MAIFITHDDEGVIVVKMSGWLSVADVRVLEKAIEKVLAEGVPVRMLMIIRNFRGFGLRAAIADARFDFTHFMDVHRLAMVGETGWERFLGVFARPLTAEQARYFTMDELDKAWRWLREPTEPATQPPPEPRRWPRWTRAFP